MKLYNGKTIEEIKDMIPDSRMSGWVTRDFIESIIKQTAEACTPRWISVEERLPEEHLEVICFGRWCWSEKEMYTFSGFFCDGYWWSEKEDEDSHQVTHWMPLPEEPSI